MMGAFAFIASLDNPELEKAEIELQSVEVQQVNTVDNIAILDVVFLVKNPSEKTFTVPSIVFTLYANELEVGEGKYSTEDVSMPGRAAFYGGVEIPLKTSFNLVKATVDSEIYDSIVNGESVEYTADGVIIVETAMALLEKEF